MAYAMVAVLGVTPWWSPQYLIPVLGMVLGNTISGVSVGLSAVMEELTTGGIAGAGGSRQLQPRTVWAACPPKLAAGRQQGSECVCARLHVCV